MKVYRGYNKDYPNWGMRDGQNHIWTTDDLDYAIEYANIFDNGGVVEFEIDDNKVNYASEYDYEEILDDEFGSDPIDADNKTCQQIIDAGYNVLGFENGNYDVYLILDKELITSAKEIDYNDYIDEQINEVLSNSCNQLNESHFFNEKGEQIFLTKSENVMLNILKNKLKETPVRMIYDLKKGLYIFGNAYYLIHTEILQETIKNTNIYNDEIVNWDEDFYNDEYNEWQRDYIYDHYMKSNICMFQIIYDTDIEKYTRNDNYPDGYWTRVGDMFIICRKGELRKMEKIPLLWHNSWNLNTADPLKNYQFN